VNINSVKCKFEEEKEMNIDTWKDCVIKDDTWSINPIIKKDDSVCRFFSDKFDIKANMTINYLGHGMIGFHMDDTDTDITNMEIDESMRVCATHSPDDPGVPVRISSNKFNPELRVGNLYWIANADLEFQYIMHVVCIVGTSIDVNLINTTTELDNTSSIKITGKSFDITDLLECKFMKV